MNGLQFSSSFIELLGVYLHINYVNNLKRTSERQWQIETEYITLYFVDLLF
jgi:hypothetical protein